MTIDEAYANETYLRVTTHEIIEDVYHQVNIEIIYYPNNNITTIRIILT